MPYKTFTLEELKDIAEKHTQVTIRESTTGVLLFINRGARLLGMFPKKNGHNVLWVYSGIRVSLEQRQWMIGGERLWVSPERSFYYENARDFEGFHVPAGMDPGDYRQTGDLVFENDFSLIDCAGNMIYDNSLMKRHFSLIEDPYTTGLAFAGVQVNELVSVTATEQPLCGWSLAQVYTCGPEKAGTSLFPIKAEGTILPYFRPIPADRADVQDGYARFRMDASDIYKFSIKPEDTVFDNPTKAVYVSPTPQDTSAWTCTIKRTNDMPRSQKECVDQAKGDPDGPKGAIQSYNNGPGFADEELPFCEIELQLAKGIVEDGRTVSTATHELLAYAGTREEMLAIAGKALQISGEPVVY